MGAAGENRFKSAETDLGRDWRTVSDFLRDHPELIRQDDGLLSDLGLRAQDNVLDFGPAALARIQEERLREAEAREWLQSITESNFAAQTQAHAAVIDIVEAVHNADLARRIDEVARIGFGVIAGAIGVEGAAPSGWCSFTPHFIDELVGRNWPHFMGPNPYIHALFPEQRDQVKSVALARLNLWDGRQGVLAFGAEDGGHYCPDMGVELIDFVARVVERTALRWPAP